MAPNEEIDNKPTDESTPLLSSKAATQGNGTVDGTLSGGGGDDDEDRPLPMGQIFFLCFARMLDPLSFFAIFPFVPQMVKDMNVKEEDVGFYTGLIESLFSMTQMCTMFFWGKAADRYGRKPGLVASLLGVAITATAFGLSRNIWQMILFRGLAGAFSGSVVSIRSMFHEISTPKTTAQAFSFFAVSGNAGILIGPIIGSLARPADEYPIFRKVKFFHDWPYILPTAIVGAFGLIATLTTAIFVRETKPKNFSKGSSDSKTMSTWELLKYPGVPIALLTYCCASFLGTTYTAIAPVYMFTSVRLGGFGFSNKMISLFISIIGLSQCLWLLVIFPPLQRRVGTKKLLQGCGVFWPVNMLLMPLCNWFLRQGWETLFWAVAPTTQVLGVGVAMAFTGVQLALNEASPNPEVLGTLNGVGLTLQSGLRAIAPTAFSSLYAIGVKKHILGGQLAVLVLAMIAACFFPLASALPTQSNEKGKQKANDEEQTNASLLSEEQD